MLSIACVWWVCGMGGWWEELYLCEDTAFSNERILQTVLQIREMKEKQI